MEEVPFFGRDASINHRRLQIYARELVCGSQLSPPLKAHDDAAVGWNSILNLSPSMCDSGNGVMSCREAVEILTRNPKRSEFLLK
jgi:hypothetical protein